MRDKLRSLGCKVSIFIRIISSAMGGEGIAHKGQGAQSSHCRLFAACEVGRW